MENNAYYKVVRYRTNGKVHVYSEKFTDITQASDRMKQSALGKYFGSCMAHIYKVEDGKATRVKSFGIDGTETLDEQAYHSSASFTTEDMLDPDPNSRWHKVCAEIDRMNRNKLVQLLTQYVILREKNLNQANDYLMDVVHTFMKNAGMT